MLLTSANFAGIVQSIRSVTEPSAIILFGSYARNQATELSDLDILVVRERDFAPGESRRREIGDLYRAVTKTCEIPKDILLFTKAEFLAWRETKNHMVAAAWREGRILHGAI